MARPYKAKELKVLKGTFKKHREKEHPVKPSGSPTPPTWLSKEAKAEWKRVMAGYGDLGVYTSVDRAILTAYCEMWAKFVEDTRQGNLFPAAHLTQLRLLAASLGLDPSSRQKLSATPKEEKKLDPWDEL